MAQRQRVPHPILIFVAAKKNGFACYGRSSNEVPRPILIFVAARKNGFACSGRGDYDLPRPILIFVAAKKNGFACYAVATTRSVSDSILRCGKGKWFRLQWL